MFKASGWRLRVELAVPTVLYRCAACGNRTRFDVTTTRRTRAFHHYSLGGELSVEDEEVLSESVEEVSCRWCGSGTAVEQLAEAPWTASG
jgi:DNA-directed RNA polymerase subunit RPC12/RpoP